MAADECPCLINTLSRAQTCLVVQEVVVGNLEEPRAESPHVLIARTREIGFHQRILRQVVGIALVAATEGEQEASQCFLLTFHLCYEYFACHFSSV